MEHAPEAHLSRNVTQIVTIGLQMHKMLQALGNAKLEQEVRELKQNIQDGKEWLAINNGVLKSQIELTKDDVIKEAMTPDDYANLYAASTVNSTNEHLSPEDRMFYQEGKHRLHKDANTKFGIDLNDTLENNYPVAKIKDLSSSEPGVTVDLAKTDDQVSGERITPVSEEEEIYTIEQNSSVLGQATNEVLDNSKSTIPESIPVPKQTNIPKLTR